MNPLASLGLTIGGIVLACKVLGDRRRNPEFFTDANGVTHPIRDGGDGTHESDGEDYSRAKAGDDNRKMAARLIKENQYSAKFKTATVAEVARHIGWVKHLNAKYAKYDVHLSRRDDFGKSETQLEEEAKKIYENNKKHAGLRALKKKYGKDSAARIVKDFSGKTMVGATPEMLDFNASPARRAAHERRLAQMAAKRK